MGFASSGFLLTLMVFLRSFLGAFFTCFFFPAMVVCLLFGFFAWPDFFIQ